MWHTRGVPVSGGHDFKSGCFWISTPYSLFLAKGLTETLLSPILPQGRTMPSRWLASLSGVGFHWHRGHSSGFILTHSTLSCCLSGSSALSIVSYSCCFLLVFANSVLRWNDLFGMYHCYRNCLKLMLMVEMVYYRLSIRRNIFPVFRRLFLSSLICTSVKGLTR